MGIIGSDAEINILQIGFVGQLHDRNLALQHAS